MRSIILFTTAFMILSGCVSNRAIQKVQPGDDDKSCAALKAELSDLGAKFEEAKSDSGITGKNVGLAFVFWPGVIVNEMQSDRNQDTMNDRISHLTQLYNSKCLKHDD